VTTIFPGYIESEMTAEDAPPRLIVSNEKGVVALMKAIDAERAQAQVPPWPWVPLGFIMRHAPLQTVSKA
jgi:hypothetical protein